MGRRVLPFVAAATSAWFIGWVLWLCGRGIDFTDEGFYLNWIARPSDYQVSVTQFGFAYHPLYVLVGGSVAALRAANMLLLAACAWLLAFTVLRVAVQRAGSGLGGRGPDAVLALTAATTSFALLAVWLPTPNYNTLALQALLLAAAGLVLTRSPVDRLAMAGWVLAGVAGAGAFLGKPTSGAMLGVLGLAFVVRPGASGWRGPLVAVVAAVLTLAMVFGAIDGNLAATLRRHTDGLVTARLLTPDYEATGVLRLDPFAWAPLDRLWAGATALALLLAMLAAAAAAQRAPWRRVAALLALLPVLVTAGALLRQVPASWFAHVHIGFWMWAVTMAAAVAGFVLSRRAGVFRDRPLAAVGLWLCLLPAAYVFGTNSNYWNVSEQACVFWAAAAFAFLAPATARSPSRGPLFVAALAAQAIVAVIVAMSAQAPYRQRTPLFTQDVPARLGNGSVLHTEPEAARYVRELVAAGERGGFQRGTTVIDLSGRHPGAIFVLDGWSPGQGWLLGGYPGTQRYAADALRRATCGQLAGAWLLRQETSRGRIGDELLGAFGARLEDFEVVGRFNAPAVLDSTVHEQQLLRPTRPPAEANAACEAARASAR